MKVGLIDVGSWRYNKPYAPREIRLLQRWCNNRRFFRAVPHFYDFDPRRV